jgi:hypothetical protein
MNFRGHFIKVVGNKMMLGQMLQAVEPKRCSALRNRRRKFYRWRPTTIGFHLPDKRLALFRDELV